MKDWTIVSHFIIGALLLLLLLLVLPLIVRAQPILTPYALDRMPAPITHR